MLAISIVLFVVPDNSYLVMFQHYFTYRISLFRNQNLNIQEKRLRLCKDAISYHTNLTEICILYGFKDYTSFKCLKKRIW